MDCEAPSTENLATSSCFSGVVVVVLKFSCFAWGVFFSFVVTCVFCWVLLCTGINMQELLRKQKLISFFKLQGKIRKGKLRKALQSPPLWRIQSLQETAGKNRSHKNSGILVAFTEGLPHNACEQNIPWQKTLIIFGVFQRKCWFP